jgi:hypothetical protein
MYVGPSPWILLAMAGIPVVLRGWHSYARARLFVFPPPLVGVELGHEGCGCSFFGKCLCLCWCPATDLKLLWTKRPDKLVVEVALEGFTQGQYWSTGSEG